MLLDTTAFQLLFWGLAALTCIAVPLYARRGRSMRFARFAAVLLALSLPGALLVHARLRELLAAETAWWLDATFAYGVATCALHLGALVRARLRHRLFRIGVSVPGQVFLAAGFLSGAWLLLLLPLRAVLILVGWDAALHALRFADAIPLVLAVASLVTSTRPVEELVRIRIPTRTRLSSDEPDGVKRVPVERYRRRRAQRAAPLAERPLRVVQITDPHLGPWQPIAKLRRHIATLVDRKPDLVLLTGDFLTMEGSGTPGGLAAALDPLQRLDGRCFAIFGNHDHESPEEVRNALEANGIRLLVDEEAIADTEVGAVQIIGADYVGRGRREHIQELLEANPRRDDHLRLLLLHDPLGFQYVPKGAADLTLSGHTHGGQIGLVSFGLDWTVLTRTQWPDHGLFGHGPNRLYVHRGTGFYGFPIRLGVPGEASLLELVVDPG